MAGLIGRYVAPNEAVAPAGARVPSGGGIRIAVTDVRMDCPLIRYPALGTDKRTERPVLCLRLRIANPGSEAVGYRTWRRGGAVLRSRHGALSPCAFGGDSHPVGIAAEDAVAAGGMAEDVLFFIGETRASDELVLELDGGNCGGRGKLVIRIPESVWAR